jgi:hypothetical protein
LNSQAAIAIKDGAQLNLQSKLQLKYYMPYEVIERVGSLAYLLWLPPKS